MAAQRSTPEENKAFVRQHFEDFVNNRQAEVIRRDEKMMQAMYASMPNLRVTIEDMVAEGDKVILPQRVALEGRDHREAMGVPWVCRMAAARRQDC